MIKKKNPETGEIEEVPEYLTLQVEGDWPRNFPILQNTYKSGTRGWECFAKTKIKGEKVNLTLFAYVIRSQGTKEPWWWEKRETISEKKARLEREMEEESE